MSKHLMDSKKGETLYLQIKNILIQRIQSGEWKPNTLIPTEKELTKEFNVSRTTIRQAVSILVQIGLLEKRQGYGTIVKEPKLIGSLERLKGFAEVVVEKGRNPRSKLIRAEFKDNLFHEREMLNLSDDVKVLLIERVRFADDTPIALERTCWPEHVGKILMKYDLNEARYYDILEQHNVFLKKANDRITAINATVDEADLLGIRSGEALLEMTRLSFGLDDEPIEYTRTKYRSDQYHYNIELKR